MINHFYKKWLHLKERKTLQENITLLIEESDISWRYAIYTVISSMIAALGIIMNNTGILVGAMLIAPLLTPVISLAVGVGAASTRLIGHSIKSLSLGLILGLSTAYFIAWATGTTSLDPSIHQNFGDSFLYSIVAFLSGILAIYSWFRPGADQVLPGVAIAVALMPPIAFAGVNMAMGDETVMVDALQLIFTNITGIFLGGFLTFVIFSIISIRPKVEVDMQIDKAVDKHEKNEKKGKE
jgi:uncharacterized hydrophobic protein (TIGR00271 family)